MATTRSLDSLFRQMRARGDTRAVIEGDRIHGYAELLENVTQWEHRIEQDGLKGGDVVAVRSEFSFAAITLVLALFRTGCIVAFVSPTAPDVSNALADAGACSVFQAYGGALAISRLARPTLHPLVAGLGASGEAGFIIFTSGSSGRPKAVLHHLGHFLGSYSRANKAMATLAFLLFDHVAGLDTLFYTIHAGGCLVLPPTRAPLTVAALIERWRVEVLPTSPSFLKLLSVSGAAEAHDLSSLNVITFGSEPMPSSTLQRIAAVLPNARLLQKYGASEFGAPRVETRGDNGLWLRLASDETEVRVMAGLLWIRAATTMLGYLNAENPVRADGWLCTGDMVETDGDWLRVIGRSSDLINVGGEKVYPSEVEAVIAELESVEQVAARSKPHPLLGQVVAVTIVPRHPDADPALLRQQVRSHCRTRLQRHMIPASIAITGGSLVNDRQKLIRSEREQP